MQHNSAADTRDDNMCDEITNATIGAVMSSVQNIVQQAARTAWAQDDHVGAAMLTVNCLSKHFNTADEDMPLRTLEIAYDCGDSHDEISGFCCKLRRGGTRDPRLHSQLFLAAIDKVRDLGSSDDNRYGVFLSGTPRTLTW